MDDVLSALDDEEIEVVDDASNIKIAPHRGAEEDAPPKTKSKGGGCPLFDVLPKPQAPSFWAAGYYWQQQWFLFGSLTVATYGISTHAAAAAAIAPPIIQVATPL